MELEKMQIFEEIENYIAWVGANKEFPEAQLRLRQTYTWLVEARFAESVDALQRISHCIRLAMAA